MGGTLTPEETPGGGLTMVVSLTAAPTASRDPAGHEPSRGLRRTGVKVTRVLVVDDEPQILRALAINLRARHYDVFTAATGADALSEAAAHNPDLVVLDLGLPDIDGVEVIRGLRGWSDAPIVILSGRTDSADKVDALDAGADDYVTKPFAVDELLARLRAVSRRAVPGRHQPVGHLREHHCRPVRQTCDGPRR